MAEPRAPRTLCAADWMAAAAAFGLLFAVYWLTASFTFISDDEVFLFDATESFVHRQTVMVNATADLDWPGHTRVEPMQPLLSMPLFWLADRSAGAGNVHTTLLFNQLTTAATAAVLLLFVRRLSYSRGAAIAVAVAYGLTTIAWPYSDTYFREPLATMTLFVAAYALVRWRQALDDRRPWPHRWLLLALVSGIMSVFAKESGTVGVPVLLIVPFIGRRRQDWTRLDWLRAGLIVGVLFAVAFAGLYFYTQVLGAGIYRFDPGARLSLAFTNFGLARNGVVGFLLSPGKGLFWHSPILLLALLAPWLVKERRLDVTWPLLLLAAFVLAYALVRADIWFGGTNWGPRYMVPLTPFLMLGVAPAAQRATEGRRRRLWQLMLGLLCLAGLAVQIGAVGVNPLEYYAELDRTGIPGAAWTVALWVPYYSAILGHWRLLLNSDGVNFAWAQALPQGPDWLLAVVLLVVAVGFAAALVYAWRREVGRLALLGFVAVAGFTLASATWFGLRRIYPDQRYQGGNDALHAMQPVLHGDESRPDPVIFLNNRTYFNFMLNYYKGAAAWYTLELNPKELIPAGAAAPAPSTDPLELLNADGWSRVDFFARQHQTAYLVMETGPYHPNTTRPMEWWMNTEFHRVRTLEFAANVRLIEYSSTAAPKRSAEPEFRLRYMLGEQIALRGFDPQPGAGSVRPGRLLNVSTQWQAVEDVDQDYTIGTYLITPQGTIALQDDSQPVGGFWPTYTWRVGDIIRHNVAFVLPPDFPPGHYEIWTLLYSPLDGSRLPVRDATGTSIRDHVVLYSVEVTR